jgi:hypothetical protein
MHLLREFGRRGGRGFIGALGDEVLHLLRGERGGEQVMGLGLDVGRPRRQYDGFVATVRENNVKFD